QAVVTRAGTAAPHHPGRILVKFKPGAPRGFLPGSGAARGFPGDRDLFLVDNPSGISAPAAIRHYQSRPGVIYAEPDYAVSADLTPSDPLWANQWDMVK